MTILRMTETYAHAISRWKYDDIYSFYDQDESHIAGLMDGTHFVCIDEDGTLIGYYCFGAEARIPTVESDVYDENYLDIGLGMRPDLCGQGYGLSFLSDGLNYGKKLYGTDKYRLSVATFNKRAIKLYDNAGFEAWREVTNSYYNTKFLVMLYDWS